MSGATGQEILTELIRHLGFDDVLNEIRQITTLIPVMRPRVDVLPGPTGILARVGARLHPGM
jgi:myosin-crossreactive antigen